MSKMIKTTFFITSFFFSSLVNAEISGKWAPMEFPSKNKIVFIDINSVKRIDDEGVVNFKMMHVEDSENPSDKVLEEGTYSIQEDIKFYCDANKFIVLLRDYFDINRQFMYDTAAFDLDERNNIHPGTLRELVRAEVCNSNFPKNKKPIVKTDKWGENDIYGYAKWFYKKSK